jgi:hypothetical protein
MALVPTALVAVTLTLAPGRVNTALIRAKFPEWLPPLKRLRAESENVQKVSALTLRLPCSNVQTVEKLRAFSAEPKLVEIVVRIAHVRVFRLVTDFGRKFRVTAMDVRNF